MNTALRKDQIDFVQILSRTLAIAADHLDHQKTLPPSLNIPDESSLQLKNQGIGAMAVLEMFAKDYASRMANSAGPRYFGFVTGGATPASVAGDWLVSVYDQVMSGSSDSVAHVIERETIRFLIDLFQLGDGFTGTFVTGATMSNFVSLATARQWVGEQFGKNISEEGNLCEVPIHVISATPHSSILKSLSMLGLGRKAWVKVDTLPGREAIDITKLERQLQETGGPAIVVANAGTVNTVDFDDLFAIGMLKKKYNFFFHVDAAFGGFAAASPKFKKLMDGVQFADTVTIDAHKWLNVPYDSAMQFTKHKSLQIKVFQNNAAYLGDPDLMPDSMHLTPENSRRFRALPAWFSLLAYGKNGYQEIIERNCDAALMLGNLIQSSPYFEILAPVRMNVVCFTCRELNSLEKVRKYLNAIRDDGQVFFTPTLYQGTPAVRAAISNWQTCVEDIHLAFQVLCDVFEKLQANAHSEQFSSD